MKTKEEIEKEFREELKALLNKYGAEIEAADHYYGWSESGSDIGMTAIISSFLDKEGNCLREYNEIDLGRIFP